MPSDDRMDDWAAHTAAPGGPGRHRAPRHRLHGRAHGRRSTARARGDAYRHRAPGGALPRVVLTLTAVAAVLVGSGALARTLPFRPAELLPTAGDRAEAPPAIGYAVSTPRAVLPDESAPPSAAASPPVAAEVAPSAAPSIAPPAPPPTAAPAPEPERAPAPVTVAYEAENADLSGFVRLFEVEAASGGDVVGMIGQQAGSHVRFPEVTVDAAGEYELTFYYVSAPDRQATVTVNDGGPVVLAFPGLGDANEVGSVSVPVALAAGPNVVWFGNADQPAPALDRITVTG